MNYIKLNKKGELLRNIIIVIVGLFIIITSAFITRLIYEEIATPLKAVPQFQSAQHQVAFAGFDFGVSVIDGLIFFVSLMLMAGTIYGCFRSPSDSIFFVIIFIAAPFIGLFSYGFAYITQQFIGNSVFDTISLYMPLSTLIGSNLHWICLFMLIIGAIAKYYKKQNQAGEVLI